MITLIEALNYRCLRHIRQPLRPFHVLVGPNASGKSTFMDILPFLGTVVTEGADAAVKRRTTNLLDLSWGRQGSSLELAIEGDLPHDKSMQEAQGFGVVRYAVSIGLDSSTKETTILDEQIILRRQGEPPGQAIENPPLAGSLLDLSNWRRGSLGVRRWNRETGCSLPVDRDDIAVGVVAPPHPSKSILQNLVALDSASASLAFTEFSHSRSLGPAAWAARWLMDVLGRDTRRLELDSPMLRAASPVGSGNLLVQSGANLPWVASALEEKPPERFREWVRHLQTALPDLEGIRVVERPEDRHRYIMLRYRSGLEVPSWMLSDGTLRLLALTILAYIPNPPNARPIWLVEEPENSLHPLNIETVMQSLQSVYDGQVLVSTHSPLVLGVTKPEKVLVFSRDEEQGTTIVSGNEHPGLRDWHGEVDLGTLFASGVLG